MKRCDFARRALMTAFAVWVSSGEIQAQLHFDPLLLSSNRVRLSLVGEPGVSYAIEGSTDLVNWSDVFSGAAENGRLELEADVQKSARMFFRGRPSEDLIGGGTLDVVPAVQTNYTSVDFVRQDETVARLYADRTLFTLTFPSNNVAEALTVTMTPVTNIAGLPFSGRLLGAVEIDLDDEQLMGAAELTIQFATNVDRRQIVSFTAELDGTDFSLTPDRVGSNTASIPVTRSGIFGSCLATPEEVAAVLQTINSPTTGAVVTARSIYPPRISQTSRLCFPDAVNRALSVQNRIRRQMRPLSSKIAAELSAARGAELAGATDDPSGVLSDAAALTCDFYNKNIAPRWAEASHNCALMGVLLQFALSFERQLQLLGVPEAERCTAHVLSPELLCPGFKECLLEIKVCCSGGHPGRDRLRDLVTLSRQQALLGLSEFKTLGCFDLGDPAVDEVVDICTPRTWSGTLSVKEKGHSFERTEYTKGFTELTKSYDLEFSGFVTEAQENNFGGSGLSAHLILEGPVIADEFRDNYSEADNNCQIVLNRETSHALVAESSAYSLDLATFPTSHSYILTVVFGRSDQPFEDPVGDQWTSTISTRIPPGIGCPPGAWVTASRMEKVAFGGPPLVAYLGTIGDKVDVFEGKSSGSGLNGGLETTVEFSWKLQRKLAR